MSGMKEGSQRDETYSCDPWVITKKDFAFSFCEQQWLGLDIIQLM